MDIYGMIRHEYYNDERDDKPVLISFDDLDMRALWIAFCNEDASLSYVSTSSLRRGFERKIATLISEPDRIHEIVYCDNCYYPEFESETSRRAGGGQICTGCVPNFVTCHECGYFVHTANRSLTIDQMSVCYDCVNRNYMMCHLCNGYYHHNDSDAHTHEGYDGSCCKSPVIEFTVRNNGEQPLANDTRVKIELPAGEISAEGLMRIRQEVDNHGCYSDTLTERRAWRALGSSLEQLGSAWQNKQGNYAKRLSSLAHKQFELKVPPKLLTSVGNIARDHSKSVDFEIEFTRKLNMSAEDFGNSESCLWQSYNNGRCSLKTNGGFAIRTFNDQGRVAGRAWIMPFKHNARRSSLVPTFETKAADAYIVFNGYGNLGSYTPARILSHMLGMTYRKIEFTCDPIYINSSAGYLIASEEIAAPYTDGRFNTSVDQHSSLFTRESKEKVNA